MPPSAKWILRNTCNRPVELHLEPGVTILPPRGAIEMTGLPAQCLALEKSGVLSRHAAPEPASPPDEPKPRRRQVGAGKKAGRPRSRKGATVAKGGEKDTSTPAKPAANQTKSKKRRSPSRKGTARRKSDGGS